MIRGDTRLITIVGHPLTYTLSPVFQNAGLRAAKVNAVYVPVPIEPAAFERTYRGLMQAGNFLGGNVTNPFKLRVMPLLDALTPEARAIGAVNTVWRQGRRWIGHNTDWIGFLRAAGGPGTFKGRRVWLLGAGGAARGLAYACLKDHAYLTIMSRRPEQGTALAKALDPKRKHSDTAGMDLEKAFEVARPDWILNTIPDKAFSNALGRFLKGKPRCKVFDITYDPPQTPLLKLAAKAGHQTFSGLDMLFEQGLPGFERWTARKAPRALMWKALQMALKS